MSPPINSGFSFPGTAPNPDCRLPQESIARREGAAAPWALRWGAPLVIAASTIAAFWPVVNNDFVDWDDRVWLLENYRFRGLSAAHLRWMFTTFHEGHYQPLTWVTLGLDSVIWGMDPKGFHLTNLLLHAANAVLFYALGLRLLRLARRRTAAEPATTPAVLGAAVAALLYALHPMRVESVAWATERRDVLCGLFYFLTLWMYLGAWIRRSDARPGAPRLIGVWLLGTAAMAAKSMAVSLPAVLFILNIYPLRRISGDPLRWFNRRARRVWLEQLPLIEVALAACVVAMFAGRQAMSSLGDINLADRLAITAYGYAFYVYKTVWPAVLLPLYEMPVDLDPADWVFAASGALVVAVTVVLLVLRRRFPGVLAVWACYLVILLPVVGLVQVGPQIVAERYSYLSTAGFALLFGGLVSRVWSAAATPGVRSIRGAVLVSLGVALSIVSALVTCRQTSVWRDSESLWTHVLAHAPDSSRAHNGMGMVRYRQDRKDDALDYFRRSAELRPRFLDPHLNIGNILAERGDLDGALKHFEKALDLSPGYAPAILNRGTIKAARGDLAGAVSDFQIALAARPDTPQIHYNLGTALAAMGRLAEATDHFRHAVRLDPAYADAWNNLGRVEIAAQHPARAEQSLRRALAINPRSHEANKNLGDALRALGRLEDAIEHYRLAVQLHPDYGNAQLALGESLLASGRPADALVPLRRAVELLPNAPAPREALNQALQKQDVRNE